MLSKFRTWVAPALLLVICIVVCVLNYSPGAWLSGWDTLHPEFNFGLAFERTIFGVFRIEQGLGAVAGHSHMADLPRIILLYISHFVLPLSFLRYFYIFLCSVFGTLGMYFFLDKHLVKNKSASFLGALFYLLNVGTVQTFNVPFEMFTTAFATIPFIFYFATSYLLESHNKTRNLLLFAIAVIFNSPSAYAATLWYVFLGGFAIYFLSLGFVHRDKDKHYFRHFSILISVFIALNLYWLIPNFYFILNHGAEVAKANINRLFSDQAFLKNKEFGNINDLLLLKSFYFDWSIYSGNGHFTNLLAPWISHLKDIKVLFVAYLFGFGYILGAVYSYKTLGKKAIPLFLLMLMSLFYLVNDNFPLSPIYSFFQNHVPFFKEAFRFPDDKILNIYVFVISIFFSFAVLFILENLHKISKIVQIKAFFVILVTILIGFYSLPTFTGNFINPYMKINIPNSYFELFKYLKTQPQTARVANLPIQSPWGWAYYDFQNNKPSFQGAGFLYFGISQPLMDRDFDRWSPYNESYYRELSYAIYSQDAKLLKSVLGKYKIGIIFIDKNVIDPQNPKSVLFFAQSKDLIEQTGLVKDERAFGQIQVFRLKTDISEVSSINTNINVAPATTTTYQDFAYDSFGNYLTSTNSKLSSVTYPFRDLIDNGSKLHEKLLSIGNDKITLVPSKKIENYALSKLTDNISLIPSDLIVEKDQGSIKVSIYPNTPVFDQNPSTLPIKSQINIGSSKNISLSFNQSEFFSVSDIPSSTPVAVGKISLKNDTNTLSVFDTSSFDKIGNGLSSLNPFFSSCDGQNAPTVYINQNQINLKAKGKVCITIPNSFLSQYKTGKSLLIKPQFSIGSNVKISSCLLDLTSLNCIRYFDSFQNQGQTSFNYVVSQDQIGKTAIEIFIEPNNQNTNSYSLKNINFSYTSSLSDIVYSKTDIQKLFTASNVSFSKVYLSKNIIYDPGFDILKVKNFQNDCPTESNSNKQIATIDGQKAIEYTSKKGSYCDHFSYPNLEHNQGYLVTVYSKNQQGLPMSLCISNNLTGRCDIYSDLTPFKKFDKDVFLLPPMGVGIGYNINLENIGINKSPSQNLISKIEFIPIPYQFLSNINTEINNINQFNGKIESVIKVNPLFYLVKTDGNQTLANLNLSFEKGFRAYNIDCSNGIWCKVKAAFAPIFEKEIDSHVLVNNWSNGWILNGNQSQIAIIFVPQYFEFIGFLVIVFIFLSLILHHKNK